MKYMCTFREGLESSGVARNFKGVGAYTTKAIKKIRHISVLITICHFCIVPLQLCANGATNGKSG